MCKLKFSWCFVKAGKRFLHEIFVVCSSLVSIISQVSLHSQNYDHKNMTFLVFQYVMGSGVLCLGQPLRIKSCQGFIKPQIATRLISQIANDPQGHNSFLQCVFTFPPPPPPPPPLSPALSCAHLSPLVSHGAVTVAGHLRWR